MSALNGSESLPFETVVLVADPLTDTTPDSQTHLRRDLEKTPNYVLSEITDAVRKLGLRLHHYTEPSQLAEAASKHRRDIVLSIYGGEESRNRMALVPAVCESFGLRYVGADAYGRIICQDKEISKRLAKEAGLNTPAHLIIRDHEDLSALRSFPLPFVVKPLWEGSSIGIGPDSLVRSAQDGIAVADRLIRRLRQPLLIEAFVPGIEVNYSLIQLNDRTETRLTQVVVPDSPDYFDLHLFEAEEKLHRHSRFQNHPLALSTLSKSDRDALSRLPNIVGGLGYGRVDGKIHGNVFHFLELTPDAWLAASGSFASGFLQGGWSYEEVIKAVLLSRRE
jgi:D-alanine-D-alanine ligase